MWAAYCIYIMHAGFPGPAIHLPRGKQETNMLEYVIGGANVVCLAGCVYVAYLIVLASRARASGSRKNQNFPGDSADHELLFRIPCADYYI